MSLRKIGTVLYNQGDHKFWARDCDDTASFVPEGATIPIYDGMDDFTSYDIYSYKLAAVVRLDEDFVFSLGYNLEKHMTAHMSKAFSRAEEKAFITGNGTTEPTGILADEGGAEIGVTISTLTYDDVVALYFSVKPEYRKNGKWLMTDETAFALRRIKAELSEKSHEQINIIKENETGSTIQTHKLNIKTSLTKFTPTNNPACIRNEYRRDIQIRTELRHLHPQSLQNQNFPLGDRNSVSVGCSASQIHSHAPVSAVDADSDYRLAKQRCIHIHPDYSLAVATAVAPERTLAAAVLHFHHNY